LRIAGLLLSLLISRQAFANAEGPLVVSSRNSRYFETPGGRIVVLAGAHTWENLVPQGRLSDGDPPTFVVPGAFSDDFDGYLDYLQSYGFNFTRLWAWENARWNPNNPDSDNFIFGPPLPYARTGPGTALDGKPRFDLDTFDPTYFNRLRSAVIRLGLRDMYAEVMLFQGWSNGPWGPAIGNPWPGNIFNQSNNIQGLNGDTDGNGDGREINTMSTSGDIPAIRSYQEAYVRHVIDVLNDLPNVLYEIANEPLDTSVPWQQHMVDVIDAYQQTKPNQHPVGVTGCVNGCDSQPSGGVFGIAGAQFAGPAANLSSNPYAWPPPGQSGRVGIADSDHYSLANASQPLIWQLFLQGWNVAHMDLFDCTPYANQATYYDCAKPGYDPAKEQGAKVAIGQIARLGPHLDLANMVPSGGLSSDGYALADTTHAQKDVLAYTSDGALTLDLSSGSGQAWSVYWMDADDGTLNLINAPVTGAASVPLTCPFASGRCVVLVTQGSSELSYEVIPMGPVRPLP